jgi:hypothetical protein
MAIKVSDSTLATAQEKHPDSKVIPANSAKITSWYRKGEIQPWFKPVEDWEPVKDELICDEFVNHHNIEFNSKKGETPEGTKIYYLTEGVYMGKIFADSKDEKGRIVFYAVTEKGKLTEISGDQASELAAMANGRTFKKKERSDVPGEDPNETPED